MMGGSTFAIGLLPTYASIGIWAAVLLTICRFFQGIALGGEWGGAVLMAVEYAPPQRRGFFGSVVQIGATLGLALATIVLFAASYYLSKEEFLAWGWRVPFLLSIIMMISGLYIRMKVTETPAFRNVQAEGKIAKYPIVEVLKNHPKVVVYTALVYLGTITVPFYTVWVFLTYYATSVLKLDRSQVLLGVVLVNLLLTFVILMAGSFSDRVGKKPILVIGSICMMAVAFPFFMVLDLREMKWVWIAMLMLATPLWAMWAVLPAYFVEQFPEQLRYTGISLGSQAATIVGGLVPLFATAMLPLYGTWPISVLLLVCALLGLGSLLALNRGELERSTGMAGVRVA